MYTLEREAGPARRGPPPARTTDALRHAAWDGRCGVEILPRATVGKHRCGGSRGNAEGEENKFCANASDKYQCRRRESGRVRVVMRKCALLTYTDEKPGLCGARPRDGRARCETAAELPEKMAEFLAFDNTKPVFMECLVERNEHVFPMVAAGKALHEYILHPSLRKT
ncbi:hypothetical protein B0H12DRAFT_1079557 [Mycena haematopus]|nr:hypothetical protein B0H12DRAFT_1079557 [Mycena haematopus]